MLLNLISKLVLLEKEYIVSIADTASWRYKRFFINKKNGKLRAIYHPAKELKAIQRVVHDEVLKNCLAMKPVMPTSKVVASRNMLKCIKVQDTC
ncbi:hypothetical protein ABMX62_00580 [Vibrio vulnificus]|uniref:hypothetical protein n=1 Tax=Vibrio vulnificus TaxID=672 RepID=UPI004057E2E9